MSQKDRAYFEKIVAEKTFKVEQYSAISNNDCFTLLGADKFFELLKDPIRKHGPVENTVYPWNVVDYLMKDEINNANINN